MQNLKMFAQTLRAYDRSQTDGQADFLIRRSFLYIVRNM